STLSCSTWRTRWSSSPVASAIRVRSSSLNRAMRATISLKCRASTPNSSVVVTVTGAGAPSSAAAEIASMKRRIGRSTTYWMATVIRTPISASEAAPNRRGGRAGGGEPPHVDPPDRLGGARGGKLTARGPRHCSLERDRGHDLPVMLASPADRTRDDAAALDVLGITPVERKLAPRLVGRDQGEPVGIVGEDVELEHARADLEQAHDQLVELRRALELAAAPDGGRHLPRVDDRAVLEILLDRASREAEAHPREPRGDREDDEGAEEGELVSDAEAQTAPPPRDGSMAPSGRQRSPGILDPPGKIAVIDHPGGRDHVGFPSEAGDAVEGQGPSGPERAHACARGAFREPAPADGAVSGGARDGHVRPGLLLGRGAQVLGGSGGIHHGG